MNKPGLEALFPGAVHIWKIDLAGVGDRIQLCRDLLSADEKQRADRFYFDLHRNRFTAARAAMRTILAWYLECAPAGIAFTYSRNGKPELAGSSSELRLKFNLSHSHNAALLGVTLNSSIGVDVELIDLKFSSNEIACRFFSPTEVRTLLAQPEEQQTTAFFNCWTRKEAYIKAVGEGLSMPLDSFDVAFGQNIPAGLLRVEASPEEIFRWKMYDIPAPANYVAAAVVEGREHSLLHLSWDWNDINPAMPELKTHLL